MPTAVSIADPNDETELWTLFDKTGKLLGTVARTLPDAEAIVGYRGPTEAVILFDPKMNILSVRLLQSADTDEHVQAVIDDEAKTDTPTSDRELLKLIESLQDVLSKRAAELTAATENDNKTSSS